MISLSVSWILTLSRLQLYDYTFMITWHYNNNNALLKSRNVSSRQSIEYASISRSTCVLPCTMLFRSKSTLSITLSLSLSNENRRDYCQLNINTYKRNRRWRCEKTLIASTYYIPPRRGRPPTDTCVRGAAAVQR